MRKLFPLIIIFLAYSAVGNTQFYKSFLPSPEFTKALEKVVLDFRFNYKNLKDSIIRQEAGTETFSSSVMLPGTTECYITFYNSKQDTTASWQAVVYRGASYQEAVKAYQNVFRLVKKSHLNWIDRSLMRFYGDIETPKKEVGFATSTLLIDLEDVRYKRFEAVVELLNSGYDRWEVNLNIQSKKLDTEQF